jgi:aspartyl/asparaginyl beta-hydroxylase (cupin superfamily)
MGEAWVFDDTIEHEAWNHGGTHRYILILDVWNPALSLEERLLIKELMVAKASFNHSSISL